MYHGPTRCVCAVCFASDTTTVLRNYLPIVVMARNVRLVIQNYNSWISMRLGIYGCLFGRSSRSSVDSLVHESS